MCGLWAHGGRVHPHRVVVPTPKPHDAPPGVVPFYRFLQSQNQIERPVEATKHPEPIQRSPDSVEMRREVGLLPKLGELPEVEAAAQTRVRTEQVRQQHVPATGRVLDLYI